MALSILALLGPALSSQKGSSYTPYQYQPDFSPTKENANKWAGANYDLPVKEDVTEKPSDSKDSSKDEGYGDKPAWISAAVNLLSDLERERQQANANLQGQANASANYGLNAMGATGSALSRLNQGRMGRMGLSSMAGV